MIHVNKKELEDRVFVPYEIKIVIDTLEDHQRLKRELMQLEARSGSWYNSGQPFIRDMVRLIYEHI